MGFKSYRSYPVRFVVRKMFMLLIVAEGNTNVWRVSSLGSLSGDCVPARQSEIELFSGNARQESMAADFSRAFLAFLAPRYR